MPALDEPADAATLGGEQARLVARSVVVVAAMLVICLVGYIAYQSGVSGVVNDCLKLNQFQKDGRVFSCYVQDESDGEDA